MCGSAKNCWFTGHFKQSALSTGECLIRIGAEVDQCSILALGLVQERVEAEAEGVRGNTVDYM